MIDRANFRRLNPNYDMPQIKEETQDQPSNDFQPGMMQPGMRHPDPSTFHSWLGDIGLFILIYRPGYPHSPCSNQQFNTSS